MRTNTTDRVWAVRCTNSATAWRRETGDLHVSGFHPFLWPTYDRTIHCLADYGEEADGREAQSHQGRTSTPEASSYDRGRSMASEGCTGLLPISCRSWQHRSVTSFHVSRSLVVAECFDPSQSTRKSAMGSPPSSLEPMDSPTPCSASLSRCSLCRHSSQVRAVCVEALVRICAGGAEQSVSLPRP